MGSESIAVLIVHTKLFDKSNCIFTNCDSSITTRLLKSGDDEVTNRRYHSAEVTPVKNFTQKCVSLNFCLVHFKMIAIFI